MCRVPKISKFCLLFTLTFCSSAFAVGQDLGNSGGLTGSSKSKPKTESSTPKKTTTSKPKVATVTKKVTTKTTTASTKATRKTNNPTKKQVVSKTKTQVVPKQNAETQASVVVAKPVAEVYVERF